MTENNTGKCCAKKGALGIIILLIAVAFFIVWNNQKTTPDNSAEHYGTWLEDPKPVHPFTLQSTQGGDFTEQNFKNHWSWVFFGFTNCPDMCPNTMKAFKAAVDKLRQDNVSPLPQVILISLDPQRDTIPVLQKYVTAFDPTFIGLAGSMEQVSTLAQQMNVTYQSIGEGRIQHSGTVTVVNPDGKIQGYFPWVDEPQKVAADYEEMIKKHSN